VSAAHDGGAGLALDGPASTGELSGPRCILPGCGNAAAEQGMPCDDCAAAFGTHLRQTDGPRMSAEERARRDTETQATYAALFAGGDPAHVEAAGGRSAPADRPAPEPERKANQRCWMCEERRTCTKQAHGWECDACREIR
jgi:hypothetical protein